MLFRLRQETPKLSHTVLPGPSLSISGRGLLDFSIIGPEEPENATDDRPVEWTLVPQSLDGGLPPKFADSHALKDLKVSGGAHVGDDIIVLWPLPPPRFASENYPELLVIIACTSERFAYLRRAIVEAETVGVRSLEFTDSITAPLAFEYPGRSGGQGELKRSYRSWLNTGEAIAQRAVVELRFVTGYERENNEWLRQELSRLARLLRWLVAIGVLVLGVSLLLR